MLRCPAMKRDMDLIRAIMLEREASPDPRRDLKLSAHGFAPEEISYHVKLLHQAGYVEAIDFSTLQELEWRPTVLTWQGHEFLATTRNEKVWAKVKAVMKDRGISLPFSLIQELAIKIAAS